MVNMWIGLTLFAALGAAAGDSPLGYEAEDFWQNDYDDTWYDQEAAKLGIVDEKQPEITVRKELHSDYYQYEDNRSEARDEASDNVNADVKEVKNADANKEENVNYADISEDNANRANLEGTDELNVGENDNVGDKNIANESNENKEFEYADVFEEDKLESLEMHDKNAAKENDESIDDTKLDDNYAEDKEPGENDNHLIEEKSNESQPLEDTVDSYETNLENTNDETVQKEIEDAIFDIQAVDIDDRIEDQNNKEEDQFSIEKSVIDFAQPDIEKIIEEANKLLEEDKSSSEEDISHAVDELNKGSIDNQPGEAVEVDLHKDDDNADLSDVLEETKRLLEKTNSDFEEDISQSRNNLNENELNSPENEDTRIEKEKQSDSGEDTVDKVYEDLDEDLKKLFETWDKLNSDDSIEGDDVQENIEEKSVESIEEQDYINIEDKNLSELFEEENNPDDDHQVYISNVETDEDESDKEQIESNETHNEETQGEIAEESRPIEHIEDGLVPAAEATTAEKIDVQKRMEELALQKVNTTRMIGSYYDAMITDFKSSHKDIAETTVSYIENNSDVIHIPLTAGETVVITSPNYPGLYPTNNIIDWVLEGEGRGIDFKIHDFAVNGILGDYVLVWPREDEPGLLFTYYLNEPMWYRFLDVNRVHIRFQAHLGMMFMRGFNMSITLMPNRVPRPEAEPELPPALPSRVVDTLTLYLGGVTPEEFYRDKQQEFRAIVADMAIMYIHAHGIDPGLNTTMETTEIRSVGICNVYWPNYERCVEVMFGVPLYYDTDTHTQQRLNETELRDMWLTYYEQDPFAARLARLGIQEFSMPRDSSVLVVWLVVASGVLVCAGLLAAALWRFNCIHDYTRMSSWSDTESLASGKDAALYPAPHQPLPPLFHDDNYKWVDTGDTATVVSGGFSNAGYKRDALYDIEVDGDVESDEDAPAPPQRDRYTTDV